MKAIKTIGIITVAGLVGAGAATYATTSFFLKKTLIRQGGVNQKIVDKFADSKKMSEYMEKMSPIKEWMAKRELENVYIKSRDDIKLHAYYLAADEKTDKVAIMHHGFSSKAMDNMVQAKFLHDLGFEVLMLDMRAHGESEGDYVGFGILDRFDTLEWIKYVKAWFGNDVKLVLQGVSMGGTTALMALGIKEIQDSVSAVIADCAFTSPAEIFSKVFKDNFHIFPKPIISLSSIKSKKMAGFSFDDYSTVDALIGNKVPVLFIHGKEDLFVPTWMSEKNYEVCTSPKELLMVENAGHGSSAFENPELYRDTMTAFLKKYFPEISSDCTEKA